MDFEVGMLQT